MAETETTCWTLIHGAAAGDAAAREDFARRYLSAVSAYLGKRWEGSPLLGEIDDAVQEVFVECLRQGGVLEKVEAGRPGGFRAFLYAVVRNVARRFETKRSRRREGRVSTEFEFPDSREASLSGVFDRAWADARMKEAGARHAAWAAEQGEKETRRVELLKLRFHEGKQVHEIAALWDVDAAWVHKEYERARRAFRRILKEVVAFYHDGTDAEVEGECEKLRGMLAR